MLAILTNALPILLGFVAKLIALKSQASTDNQKLLLEAFAAKNDALNNLRDRADKESPMAAWNRRIIILVILALIIFTQIAPVFNVDTVIPTINEAYSLFGIKFGTDTVTYERVTNAIIKYDEVFKWATMIIEFYFGSQLAKGK